MKGKKLTKEELIKKFETIHNNEYIYNIDYSNLLTPIEVTCKIHGNFTTTPNTHLYKGNKCPKCKIEKRSKNNINIKKDKVLVKKEQFLEKIKNKPYDYSLCVFIDNTTPIKIICKEHGVFVQTPVYHLTKYGVCPKCVLINKGNNFLSKAKAKFKNHINYDKFVYTGSTSDSIFICSQHGEFLQSPTLHLMATEPCPVCRGVYGDNKEEFIKRIQSIHGDKYDFTLVKYINNRTVVELICKIHGSFWITPNNLINNKNGCSLCNHAQQTSTVELEWLNSLLVPIRSYKIDSFKVDGYNPATNTIYEFLGDYWHGNLTIYDSNDINKSNKQTYGELYKKTFERFDLLKQKGYNIVYIWESDFLNKKDAQIY